MTLDRRADGDRTLEWDAMGRLASVTMPDGTRELNTYDGMMQRQRRRTLDADGTITAEVIYLSDAEELRFGGEDGDLYVSYVRLGTAHCRAACAGGRGRRAPR